MSLAAHRFGYSNFDFKYRIVVVVQNSTPSNQWAAKTYISRISDLDKLWQYSKKIRMIIR